MKKIGIIILAIGVLITIFTGLNFITREKVIDVGKIQISVNKKHAFEWSPLAGIAVVAVGGCFYLLGKKNK